MAWCQLCKNEKAVEEINYVMLCRECAQHMKKAANMDEDASAWLYDRKETIFRNADQDALELLKKTIHSYQLYVDAKNQRYFAEKAAEAAAAMRERDRLIQPLNPQYEYATEFIYDADSGEPGQSQINSILNDYARRGWRLHSIAVNELGRNSNSSGIGGYTSGTNATICVNILIFERCIKHAEK